MGCHMHEAIPLGAPSPKWWNFPLCRGSAPSPEETCFCGTCALKVNKEFSWPWGVNFSVHFYQRSASVLPLYLFLFWCYACLLYFGSCWKSPAWLFSWIHNLACFLVCFETYPFLPSMLQITIYCMIISWLSRILFKLSGSNTTFVLQAIT